MTEEVLRSILDEYQKRTDNRFSDLEEKIVLSERNLGVLIEHQNDKIAILAEQVADIPKLREGVRGMDARLERVEGKVDGVANYLQNNLDSRVARLEDLVSEKEYAQ